MRYDWMGDSGFEALKRAHSVTWIIDLNRGNVDLKGIRWFDDETGEYEELVYNEAGAPVIEGDVVLVRRRRGRLRFTRRDQGDKAFGASPVAAAVEGMTLAQAHQAHANAIRAGFAMPAAMMHGTDDGESQIAQ